MNVTQRATEKPTSQEPVEEIPKGGTFIHGTTSNSRGLNVLQIDDGATGDRVRDVIDSGMVRRGPDYEDVRPLLFESFEVGDDLQTMTIKLRPNLKFGNGYGQVTADDYLWTVENIWRADWFPWTYQYRLNVGKDNTPIEFEKVDDLTIRETIPEPHPFWPYNEPLSIAAPIPKQVADPYVKNEDQKGLLQDEEIHKAAFNGNMGPWDLKKYNEQSVIVFERAEDYYLRKWAKEDDRVPDVFAEAPFFDEFKVQIFQKGSSARKALEAGEIDRTAIPSTKVESFKNMDNVEIFENPFRAFSYYMGLNHRANGWSQIRNTKVRHAFANLFDRSFVVEKILGGKAYEQRTLHPEWGPHYPDDVRTHEGSISRAKKLLEEGTSSEYGYDSKGKFVGPEGDRVNLKLVYKSSTTDDLLAEYAKKRFDKAGIKVNLETTSWTSLIRNHFNTNKRAKGVDKGEPIGYGEDGKGHPSSNNYGPWDKAVSAKDWDLMLTLGFSYGPNDPAGTVAQLFGEQGKFNAYGYTPSKSIMDMKAEAKTASSKEAATKTITEMLDFLAEEQPVVFQYNPYNYTGYNKRVENVPQSPAANYYVVENHDKMYFADGTNGR